MSEGEGARTEHVFEGPTDGRQAGDVLVSRFRPRYRALTVEEKALHDEIKAKAEELEGLFGRLKAGRCRALGFTALEESVMWAIKELTG